MRLKVNFREIDEKLKVKFQEVHQVSDGGYDKGYNEGYDKGYQTGYGESYDKGFDKGFSDGKQSEYDRFWDSYQDNGNRTNYRYAFAGNAWNEELLKQIKYTIIFPKETNQSERNAMGLFTYLQNKGSAVVDMTEICKKFDFSGCLTANNLFQNASVKNITIDLSNCETLSNTFAIGDGGSIDNINLKVSEKTIFGSSNTNLTTFNNSDLSEIRFLDGSIIGNNIKFTSRYLTYNSIVNIINTLSTTTSGLTVTLSLVAVNKAFETSENANDGSNSVEWKTLIDTKKNWTVNLS